MKRLRQPRPGTETGPMLVLFLLLLAAAAAVTSALQGPDWSSLWGGLLLGLIAGWGMALAGLSAYWSALGCLFLGLSYAGISGGGLEPKALQAGAAMARLAWRVIGMRAADTYAMQAAIALGELASTTGVVLARCHTWIIALAEGQAVFDPVPASIVWRWAMWGVAGWGGWVIQARRHALGAAMPAMLIGAGALSYAGRRSVSVLLMLAGCLLLIALLAQQSRRQRWVEAGAAYPASKGRAIVSMAAVATLGLVVAGAAAPALSISRISGWLEARRRSQAEGQPGLAHSLGIASAASGPAAAFQAARQPGLPREMLIGSGPELSLRLVMTVEAQIPNGWAPSLYWRSFTYDEYTGRGWASSATEQRSWAAGQLLSAPQASHHLLIEQIIRPLDAGDGTVYAAGQPVRMDRTSDVATRPPDDLFGVQIDPSQRYTVWSSVPTVTSDTLKATGIRYPDWIRARYLSLPASVPERVKDLAISLTAGEPTPYDRVEAIEGYLREIPYSLDVSRPPLGRDVVDYFLYDLHQGYCDYYASAMVVLARAAGIPARLAVGYAEGNYDLNSRHFRVTKADAHSWAEVYFPNIGWVPFEATANRPPLEASQELPPGATPPPAPQPTPAWPLQQAAPPAGWILLASLAIMGMASAGWAGWDAVRLARLTKGQVAPEIYRRMRIMGRRMDVRVNSGVTPLEFGRAFGLCLRQQGAAVGRRQRLAEAAEALVEDLCLLQFRPRSGNQLMTSRLRSRWRGLHWGLMREWLISQLAGWIQGGRKGQG
jgi:transglutaminase-like putative cysteine protease